MAVWICCNGKAEDTMTTAGAANLQFDDIQGVVLRERPSPYVGVYIFLRIDNP
jgi:hypothetical protein